MFRPQRFGKYFLFERLAVGGMAEVFKAKLLGTETNTIYALKRIHPHHMENADFVSMLIDEAKISVQLDHSAVIQVVDIGRVGDQCFICMEYIEGKDLRQLTERCRESGTNLPLPEALYIVAQVCRGLSYAHGLRDKSGNPLNIIHRDVSPQNVLVSYDGDVKLIDFGIAKAAGRLMETQVGILKGKYAYMSPEQATGQAIDRRTDIFAAGVLLYETTVHTHPFRAPHDLETLRNIKDGKYVPPAEANPDLPPSVTRIIETALSLRAEDRYSTADEMANALDRALSDLIPRYSTSRVADFIQGLFSEEVMVRGRSLAEGSRLERDFLTGEQPAVPQPQQETFIGERNAPQQANGSGNGSTNGATVIGTPRNPAPGPDLDGTAAGPPPQVPVSGQPVPRQAQGGGPSIRMGIQQPQQQVAQVQPVRQAVPRRAVGQRPPGGPGFMDRILTGDLTQQDTISLVAFSAIAFIAGIALLIYNPQASSRATATPTQVAVVSPTVSGAATANPTQEPTAVATGGTPATSATPTTVPDAPATLMFLTKPPNALVEVNGRKLTKRTPLRVKGVQANVEYKVRLSLPGYASVEQMVKPGPGEELTVKQTLKQIPSGTISIETQPDGALIVVDGVTQSERTPSILILPAGSHTITVINPDDTSKKRTFKKTIRADREYSEEMSLE